jgi:hypothetical protein
MNARTYTVGGREFTLARPTARQQRDVNRLIRESMDKCQVDAQDDDNPLIIYAGLWLALVETESVAAFLGLILAPVGHEWSQEAAEATTSWLASIDFALVSGLYSESVPDFFSANPLLTRNLVISLVSSIKRSGRLLKGMVEMADAMRGWIPPAEAK